MIAIIIYAEHHAELNNLVRKNFLAYAPPRAEYTLQGRSMELGLDAYVKMISPESQRSI